MDRDDFVSTAQPHYLRKSHINFALSHAIRSDSGEVESRILFALKMSEQGSLFVYRWKRQ